MTATISEIVKHMELENTYDYDSNSNQTTNYLSPGMFEEFLFWLVRLNSFQNHHAFCRKSPMSPDHFVILFRLMYGCGLRVSEALHLKRSDIDLQSKILKIRDAKTGKGKVQKTTILPSDIPRLEKFFEKFDCKYDEKIFSVSRSTVWHYAKNAGLLAGLNIAEEQDNKQINGIWTHLFRKSCAKRMLYDGDAPKPLVQKKLRHSFREAVDTYLRADINALLKWEQDKGW